MAPPKRMRRLGYRLSAIEYRLSSIGYRLSAIGYRVSERSDSATQAHEEAAAMTSATASSPATLTPERLKQFFEPKTIALIGASDKSMWSIMVNGSLRACDFPGEIFYVNPKSP